MPMNANAMVKNALDAIKVTSITPAQLPTKLALLALVFSTTNDGEFRQAISNNQVELFPGGTAFNAASLNPKGGGWSKPAQSFNGLRKIAAEKYIELLLSTLKPEEDSELLNSFRNDSRDNTRRLLTRKTDELQRAIEGLDPAANQAQLIANRRQKKLLEDLDKAIWRLSEAEFAKSKRIAAKQFPEANLVVKHNESYFQSYRVEKVISQDEAVILAAVGLDNPAAVAIAAPVIVAQEGASDTIGSRYKAHTVRDIESIAIAMHFKNSTHRACAKMNAKGELREIALQVPDTTPNAAANARVAEKHSPAEKAQKALVYAEAVMENYTVEKGRIGIKGSDPELLQSIIAAFLFLKENHADKKVRNMKMEDFMICYETKVTLPESGRGKKEEYIEAHLGSHLGGTKAGLHTLMQSTKADMKGSAEHKKNLAGLKGAKGGLHEGDVYRPVMKK